ncbi:MAG: hypothetical protein ACK55Z_33205, partial [bacterium]
ITLANYSSPIALSSKNSSPFRAFCQGSPFATQILPGSTFAAQPGPEPKSQLSTNFPAVHRSFGANDAFLEPSSPPRTGSA